MPAWIKADDKTYVATAQKPNGMCHHLTVGKMEGEDSRWRWFTARAGAARDQAFYGQARSALEAMKEAERAIGRPVRSRSDVPRQGLVT